MIDKIKAPTLFLRNISLSYYGKALFNQLDLTIEGGQCTALLGVSGVGKTTLLRFIAHLIPEAKTTTFHGSIESDTPHFTQKIAYLAQHDLLLPWFNALNNALLGPRLRNQLSETIIQKAKDLFHQVGLQNEMDHYPRQLSGGMRQRVALIRTLLENKAIVLMDEPFSSLDAITRFELQTLTSTLLADRTVLLVTHDPFEALRLANEIYILSGRPATLKKVVHLTSQTPRDPADPAITHFQSVLFHELTQAKAHQL